MSTYWMGWIGAALMIAVELFSETFCLLAVGIALAFGRIAAGMGAGVASQFAVAGVLGVGLVTAATTIFKAQAG